MVEKTLLLLLSCSSPFIFTTRNNNNDNNNMMVIMIIHRTDPSLFRRIIDIQMHTYSRVRAAVLLIIIIIIISRPFCRSVADAFDILLLLLFPGVYTITIYGEPMTTIIMSRECVSSTCLPRAQFPVTTKSVYYNIIIKINID